MYQFLKKSWTGTKYLFDPAGERCLWYYRAGSQVEEFERPGSRAAFHGTILTNGIELFDVDSTGLPARTQ